MESFPSIGMTYKQSVKRGVRFAKEGSPKLVNSVANQVRLHEGEKAAREFTREVMHKGHEKRGKMII